MRLDIVVPYWGDPAYMQELVESVLAQTSHAWRLTVIDDAYPGTEIADYLHSIRDDRIRYMRKERNEGIIANFRSCVSAAQSPLMAMPGCDDRLLPHYVEEVLEVAARFPSVAIIQPGVRVIDTNGAPARSLPDIVKQRLVKPRGHGRQVLAGERLATSLAHGDWLYWPSLAFRTQTIRRFPFHDSFPVILDLALILDMVFAGESMAVSPRRVFEYRRHGASLSSVLLSGGDRFEDEHRYFGLAAEQAKELGWRTTERALRLHLTSRAYAALTLAAAVRSGDAASAWELARHVARR